MPKSSWLLIGALVACGWRGVTALADAEGMAYLPDSTPKVGAPAPMVTNDLKNLVLAKTKEGDTVRVIEKFPVLNGEAVVRFKDLKADGDQEMGIVFRYQSVTDFYVITANAGNESCTLYRVKKGQKKKLTTLDAIVTPLTWHELRITFAQDKFTAIIDGELALGVKDSGIKAAGLVGLYSQGDSQFAFEKFRTTRP